MTTRRFVPTLLMLALGLGFLPAVGVAEELPMPAKAIRDILSPGAVRRATGVAEVLPHGRPRGSNGKDRGSVNRNARGLRSITQETKDESMATIQPVTVPELRPFDFGS